MKNSAQGLRAQVTASELRVTSLGKAPQESWQIGMKLAAYGYGDSFSSVTSSEMTARGSRVSVVKSAIHNPQSAIEEWYFNRAEGIEQGFTINSRLQSEIRNPQSAIKTEPLRLTLELSGSFEARLDESLQAITFSAGSTSLVYSKLEAFDAGGRRLAARMELKSNLVTLEVDDEDAEYPVTIDPLLTQQVKLTASDGAADDYFGNSVAISGNTIVVGANYDSVGTTFNQGSAYVFVRSGTTWLPQQKLLASDGAQGDFFGSSVAISEDTIVAGATHNSNPSTPGSAYVFVRSGTAWSQQQRLTTSDGSVGDSVALDADTIVVGAPFIDSARGSAYVFVRSGTTWLQQQKLTASDGAGQDFFGYSVAISGDTVVAGAYQNEIGPNTDQGSAYVFGCGLTEQAQAVASDGQAGDLFGRSVSISGDTVVVGAENDDVGTSTDQGSAYIFVRSGMGWSQQAMLTASDGAASDNFGVSVAIDANTVVVGAWFADPTFTDQGTAYVFVRSGTTWSQQQRLFAIDRAGGDLFGGSVAISGDTAVVGALLDDGTAGSNEGSAYVFVRSGTVWSQQQKLIAASDQQVDARLGTSVAISGDTVSVGAPLHDTLAIDDGAAYVFTRSGTVWSQLQKLIVREIFSAEQWRSTARRS